jgi:hypothetical protein
MQSASSFEDAAAAARADLRTLAGDVARLACDLDLITVVSSVRVSMIMNHAMTGDEPGAILLVAHQIASRAVACRSRSTASSIRARSTHSPNSAAPVSR